MDISNQMLEAVANAKKQAKSAEKQFDFAAEMVNIKSSSSIDLFGGRAVSQVADIASSVRKACDELYASYQSLVLMLDQQCRPLLSLNPSTRAVKEVMEMIKWLNKESEIGSNFSGSLNGSSLGDLVNVKYFASMECQMIQKHWENVYSTMPGTEEENCAFNQRQMEERRAAKEAERQARIAEREWERQEREREKQAREAELQERLQRNAANAEKTAARRKYVKAAQGMISNCSYAHVFVKADGSVDAFHRFFSTDGTPGNVSRFSNIKAAVCTCDGIVGLRTNGTCIATDPGKYCSSTLWDANRWTDVQELAAGDHHVVALRTDGTCVATSILSNNCYRNYGQCNVSSWTDITAIACGHNFTIGLKKDGTVVHAGENYAREVEQWEDIVLIAAGGKSAVGVTREGKVVSAGSVNIGAMERAENIVQLAITRACAYALQADGTVVGGRPDSYDPQKKKQVSNNAVAIAGGFGLMILKEDGSVDIRIEATSQTPPSEYRLFESYESYLKEKIAAEKKFRAQATQQKAYRDAGVCQHCGGAFKKSLFSCKCTQCGMKKDY